MTAASKTFAPAPERRVFGNRTLNMRSIQVVGFDMDYTLVHYDVHAWEARAYAYAQQRLAREGLPVDRLAFAPEQFARGLVLDLELGNTVKANRFGYVTQAAHGTRMLAHEAKRRAYAQVWVDLSEPRWVFLNTLFSLSEACLYAQLVDLLDAGELDPTNDYRELYALVGRGMDAAHLEGELKAEIVATPERFVELDPDLPRALLDLRQAGKRLFLATNSDWRYTAPMMHYVLDRYLPDGTDWRSLFDLVVVQARKPGFFDSDRPFAAVGHDGATAPHVGPMQRDAVYAGGNSKAVQQHFGVAGGEILYVGDHAYADVHVSSRIQRWRTMLVLRELEHEIRDEQAFAPEQAQLVEWMEQKQALDHEQATLRLALLRLEHGGALPAGVPGTAAELQERLRALWPRLEELDRRIAPLAAAAGRLGHAAWGPLMRAGRDKSRLAREIEGFADVYSSRVSNLLHLTPFGYLQAARGSLPHDSE
ncbi:MAG: HAD-IG family 5'-nucleotidase [Planctomycetes bacterium]|nr:HAD-IG family 5'-nucleotidase [Planctomycetota bacterium]MCB9870032.1 HAD-IG family 5'-nucleotidase [Planctomycetota bacterium]